MEPPKNISKKNEIVNDWFHETMEQFCSYEVDELEPYEEEPEEQKEEVCGLGFASVYYDKQTGYHLQRSSHRQPPRLHQNLQIFARGRLEEFD